MKLLSIAIKNYHCSTPKTVPFTTKIPTFHILPVDCPPISAPVNLMPLYANFRHFGGLCCLFVGCYV